MPDQARHQGFSLVELLVVLVLLGIITAIAVPQYQRYVENSRRTAATACLMEASLSVERHYAERLAYPADLTGLSCIDGAVSSFYDFSVTLDQANRRQYILTATPKSSQANDRCGNLTLDQAGRKGPSADCW